MLFYITKTQEPSKLQINNINKEIKKTVKRDKKNSMDMIKLPHNKERYMMIELFSFIWQLKDRFTVKK